MLIFVLQMSVSAKTADDLYAYYDAEAGALVAGGVSPFGAETVATIRVTKEGNLFWFNFMTTGTDGAFKFVCPFDSLTDESGTYKVTMGGAGLDALSADDVVFVNKNDTDRIIGEIEQSTGDTLQSVLTADENKDLVCVDLGGDITLLADSAAVYTALAGKSYAGVPAFEAAFNAAVAVQRFNESSAATGEALLAAYADTLGINTKALFDTIKTTELRNDVYAAICSSGISLTADDFCKEFDKACYLALFNGLDNSDRDKLITYLSACNTAGYTDANMAQYAALKSSNDKVTVIKNVVAAKKDAKFDSLKTVENTFNAEIEKITAPVGDTEEKQEQKVITIGGSGGGGGTKKPTETKKDEQPTQNPDTPTTEKETLKFDDLATVPWAEEAIEELCAAGIANGVGNNKFNPDGNITREEFVKLIALSFNLPTEETKNTFSDVTPDDWFYEPVMNAYALGIVRGVDFDIFGTGTNITREQLCTVIYRAMLTLDVSVEVDTMQTDIADRDDISDYALNAVEAMYRAGVVSGMGDGRFAPVAYATRAQAAKIIYEVRERIGKV